jgi:hypothetical protein
MLYYYGPSWHYPTRLKVTFTLSDGAHTWKHLDHLVTCIGRLTAKTVGRSRPIASADRDGGEVHPELQAHP